MSNNGLTDPDGSFRHNNLRQLFLTCNNIRSFDAGKLQSTSLKKTSNLDIPIYVCIYYVVKISFFVKMLSNIAISELGPVSNERYENSTFYGPFRFLIFILVFSKQIILYISQFIEKLHEMACLYLLH